MSTSRSGKSFTGSSNFSGTASASPYTSESTGSGSSHRADHRTDGAIRIPTFAVDSGSSSDSHMTVSEVVVVSGVDGIIDAHSTEEQVAYPPGLSEPPEQYQDELLAKRVARMERKYKEVRVRQAQVEYYLKLKDDNFEKIIWGRTVLDQGMHQCCVIINRVLRLDSSQRQALRSDRMSGSKLWRKFLQENSPYPLHHSLSPRELELDNERRLKLADNILRPFVGTSCDTTIGNTTALKTLLDNKQAMELITERNSLIREAGNTNMHTLPPYHVVRKGLRESGSDLITASTLTGMEGILTFLEERVPASSTQPPATNTPSTTHLPSSTAGSARPPSATIPSVPSHTSLGSAPVSTIPTAKPATTSISTAKPATASTSMAKPATTWAEIVSKPAKAGPSSLLPHASIRPNSPVKTPIAQTIPQLSTSLQPLQAMSQSTGKGKATGPFKAKGPQRSSKMSVASKSPASSSRGR